MNSLQLFALFMIVLIVNYHVYSFPYPTIWKCCNESNEVAFEGNIIKNANNFSLTKIVKHMHQDSVDQKGANQRLNGSRENIYYGKL